MEGAIKAGVEEMEAGRLVPSCSVKGCVDPAEYEVMVSYYPQSWTPRCAVHLNSAPFFRPLFRPLKP